MEPSALPTEVEMVMEAAEAAAIDIDAEEPKSPARNSGDDDIEGAEDTEGDEDTEDTEDETPLTQPNPPVEHIESDAEAPRCAVAQVSPHDEYARETFELLGVDMKAELLQFPFKITPGVANMTQAPHPHIRRFIKLFAMSVIRKTGLGQRHYKRVKAAAYIILGDTCWKAAHDSAIMEAAADDVMYDVPRDFTQRIVALERQAWNIRQYMAVGTVLPPGMLDVGKTRLATYITRCASALPHERYLFRIDLHEPGMPWFQTPMFRRISCVIDSDLVAAVTPVIDSICASTICAGAQMRKDSVRMYEHLVSERIDWAAGAESFVAGSKHVVEVGAHVSRADVMTLQVPQFQTLIAGTLDRSFYTDGVCTFGRPIGPATRIAAIMADPEIPPLVRFVQVGCTDITPLIGTDAMAPLCHHMFNIVRAIVLNSQQLQLLEPRTSRLWDGVREPNRLILGALKERRPAVAVIRALVLSRNPRSPTKPVRTHVNYQYAESLFSAPAWYLVSGSKDAESMDLRHRVVMAYLQNLTELLPPRWNRVKYFRPPTAACMREIARAVDRARPFLVSDPEEREDCTNTATAALMARGATDVFDDAELHVREVGYLEDVLEEDDDEEEEEEEEIEFKEPAKKRKLRHMPRVHKH